MAEIERIDLEPLRDGMYPTSQHWNKLVEQINERILSNYGSFNLSVGDAAQTHRTWQRLYAFLEKIASYTTTTTIDSPTAPELTRRVFELLGESSHFVLGRHDINNDAWQKRRLEQRKVFTTIARDFFEWKEAPYPTRNVALDDPPEAQTAWQTYSDIWDDTGFFRQAPTAKVMGEILALWVSRMANGTLQEKAGNYRVRNIAPQFQRLMDEVQFRMAEQFVYEFVEEDGNKVEVGFIVINDTHFEYNHVDEPDGKKYRIFEIFGNGRYRLENDTGEQKEVEVDDYLWLDDEGGWKTITKLDFGENTEAKIALLEPRKATFEDACLMAFLVLCQDGVRFNYIIVGSPTLPIDPATGEELVLTPPSQLLRVFTGEGDVATWIVTAPPPYVLTAYGATAADIVESTINATTHNGLWKYYFENSLMALNRDIVKNSRAPAVHLVLESSGLVDRSTYFPVYWSTPNLFANHWANRRRGNIASDFILANNWRARFSIEFKSNRTQVVWKERWQDGSTSLNAQEQLGAYFRRYILGSDFEGLTNNQRFAFSIAGEIYEAEITDSKTELETGREDQEDEEWAEDGLLPSITFTFKRAIPENEVPTLWVRLLPNVREDSPPNTKQERTDTRLYAGLFNEVYLYLRCLCTAFCEPTPKTLDQGEEVSSDSCNQNTIRVTRDLTVERYADLLGVSNFGGARDDFGALPNTNFQPDVMRVLNDAVNALNNVRAMGIPFIIEITGTNMGLISSTFTSRPAGAFQAFRAQVHSDEADEDPVPSDAAWWEPIKGGWTDIINPDSTNRYIEGVFGHPGGNLPIKEVLDKVVVSGIDWGSPQNPIAWGKNYISEVGAVIGVQGYPYPSGRPDIFGSLGYIYVESGPTYRQYASVVERTIEIKIDRSRIMDLSSLPSDLLTKILQSPFQNTIAKLQNTYTIPETAQFGWRPDRNMVSCLYGSKHEIKMDTSVMNKVRIYPHQFPLSGYFVTGSFSLGMFLSTNVYNWRDFADGRSYTVRANDPNWYRDSGGLSKIDFDIGSNDSREQITGQNTLPLQHVTIGGSNFDPLAWTPPSQPHIDDVVNPLRFTWFMDVQILANSSTSLPLPLIEDVENSNPTGEPTK